MSGKLDRNYVAYQGRRKRGRSERVLNATLKSAFELLLEKGFDGFTISEVARRAEVHETSIYRRWGTRQALASEACTHYAASVVPIPDTGTLAGDVEALAGAIRNVLQSPVGRAISTLILSPGADGRTVRQAFWQNRQEQSHVILERARARGEVGTSIVAENLLELIVAPLFFRTVLTAEPTQEWPIAELISELMAFASRSNR